ncbi:MAG: hypothetical protein EBY16_02440 [Gammaproteobacteria bacterium]|nr:hypothetical protein [Gammaproteobacteria bacterium]
MSVIKKLWPLVCIMLLVLGFYRALELNPREIPSAKIGQKIPDLALLNYQTQKKIYFSQFLGRPQVIHFWASWCDNCVQELLLLQAWQKRHHQHIIGINYKESPSSLAQFFRLQENIFSPLLLDEHASLGIEIGVVAVPETFVLDRQGSIIYRHQGPLDEKELDIIWEKINA